MKKFIFLSFLFLSSKSFGWVVEQGDFNSGLSKLSMTPAAQRELDTFFSVQNQDWQTAYGHQLFGLFKKDFSQNLGKRISTGSSQCQPFFSVDFASSLSQPQHQATKKFESEMLRLESLDCLPSLDLENVVHVYLSDAFQMKYISGLKFSSSDEKNNWVCQRTSVFPIGGSDYCTRLHIWRDAQTVVVFSLNELNNNHPSAPVYFRAMMTVFKKLEDGTILLGNLTYGRGPDLPMHGMVKSIASKQHRPFIEGLVQEAR